MSDFENLSAKPESVLTRIQDGLMSAEMEERLGSIATLSELAYSSRTVLRQLEKMAVKDRSKKVRAAALEALGLSVHKQIFKKNTHLSKAMRITLLEEVRRWKKEGLLGPDVVAALEKRYAFDFYINVSATGVMEAEKSINVETASKAKEPKRSLGQVLFSESSIKIALYLGAFFVIAAAFIFAAAIEGLRLPILLFFTLIFGGSSVFLKKKLSQPSFTLFVVFSVLLPIDFNVLADLLNLKGIANSVYWMIVFALMAFIWAFAIRFFRSRFFSILAFLSLGVSLLFFAELFNDPPIDLYLLMLSFSGIIGLVGVSFLRKWQDEKFSNPLFLFAQVQEIILLFISLIAFLIRYDESDFANSWWLIVTAIWILAALFYICSRFLKDKLPFHYLAVISILPIPWVFFHTFGISDRAQYIIFFVWGVILALSGEALKALKNEKFKKYRQPLLFGSVLLIGTASFWGWDESYILGFSILLSGTILYALLNFYRPRLWIWSLTLLFALTSYFAFFDLDGIRSWDFYFGFKLLIPSLFFLLPDIILKNDFKIHPIWHFPPRFLGVLLFFINTAGSLFSIQDNAGKVVLIFGIYAFLTLAYAFRYFSQIAYAANTYFTLIIIYILRSQDAEHWLAPLIALTIAFYLIGWGLERVKNTSRWADVYRYSGLILGALISFSAPFEGTEFLASIPVALAAMLFTVEAFKKRNIWLGFPANALYLMSYFMILMNFDIDQPQFFSVVPAVLGMLMHYLLVRSGSKTAAFSTGMLSQLVLLSTTYVQMVSEERLVYFVVLFFQALAVLVYGIISRSRSMIVTPIVFLIVGVMTITFGLLEGLPTILLIGCTGVFLIIFGIGALLLREKVAGLREKLDKWSA